MKASSQPLNSLELWNQVHFSRQTIQALQPSLQIITIKKSMMLFSQECKHKLALQQHRKMRIEKSVKN
jgi:hypothetical protein